MSEDSREDPFADLDEVQTALSPSRAPIAQPTFALVVLDGPDAGARWELSDDLPLPILAGTSPVCALRFGDRQVSRRHAAFEKLGPRLLVRDLGSTNGTFVQGVSVVEAHLRGGEQITIGQSNCLLAEAAGSPRRPATVRHGFGRVVGFSEAMQRLYPILERLASSDVPVVIEGESGTGKEVLAESLHQKSPRRDGPYVVFDCTTVAASLLEAELFGHERGAFTGAATARKGVFEQAHGGTLFIDEIGDLDLSLQPKLLRAIERAEIRPLGANSSRQVDVRILSATRRDLDRAVQDGRFRDDLFHRLAVGRIELPPLRRREGDVPVLAQYFWTELGGQGSPPPELLVRWEGHEWPGNVRELRNTIARYLALGELDAARPSSLPPSGAPQDYMMHVLDQRLPFPVARVKVLEEFQRRYVEQALAECSGNVGAAAEASGVARRYFQILRGGRTRR